MKKIVEYLSSGLIYFLVMTLSYYILNNSKVDLRVSILSTILFLLIHSLREYIVKRKSK